MKKALSYLFVFTFLLIFFAKFSFAENIQIGNSSVQSNITNTVNGSNCQTYMEVTINGEKKVLDSTDCGTHTLNESSNSNSQSPIPSATVFIPQKSSPIVSPSPTVSVAPTVKPEVKKEIHKSTFIENFVKTIGDILKKMSFNLIESFL